MSGRLIASVAIVAALAAGAWYGRDNATVRQLASTAGLPLGDSTPATSAALATAGVHKCRSQAGTVYLDRACPPGSREVTPTGGTVTVMSFPKVAPVREAASEVGSAIVKGMPREEVERLREKRIEDAANR